MANTTYSGPVRSVGGFQVITINATTGAVATTATFAAATSVTSLAATTVATTQTTTARSATGITAGGQSAFLATSTANFGIYFGSGVPTTSAAKGSLYLRSDGTTTNDRAYINTDGATTWTALTTVA